jgi:hypothetical protein
MNITSDNVHNGKRDFPIYAMNIYKESSSITPITFSLGAKFRSVINITPRPVYLQEWPSTQTVLK